MTQRVDGEKLSINSPKVNAGCLMDQSRVWLRKSVRNQQLGYSGTMKYDESTVRGTMLGITELERHTFDMAIWHSESLTVTTDMATVGRANYVNESAATIANYGEDMTT